METARSVTDLAEHVGGNAIGDGEIVIRRVASLELAGDGDIAYVEDEKLFAAAVSSKALPHFPHDSQVESPLRMSC